MKYSPSITYHYIYEKKEYTSSQYDFYREGCSKREKHEKILQEFPEGKNITCYVNPSKPTEAVLNNNFRLRPILIFSFLAILFLVIGSIGMHHLISSGRGPFDPPSKYSYFP